MIGAEFSGTPRSVLTPLGCAPSGAGGTIAPVTAAGNPVSPRVVPPSPGTRIVLELDGTRYEYHSGGPRSIFLCEHPEPPVGE